MLPMRTDEWVYVPDHMMGHCWALAVSSRAVLTRRTTVRDHTRVVPWHFAVPGEPGNKVYAYHLMAHAAALINEISLLDGGNKYFVDLPYTLSDLQTVTKGKRADSSVLCHACGNAFCENPFHLKVATKAANDEEEHCHHFLRRTSALPAFTSFRDNVCTMLHASPYGVCWTNVYNYADLDARRMSLSQLPIEEVLQQAQEMGPGGDLGQDPGVI